MFPAGIDAGQSFGNILALGIPTALAFNVVVRPLIWGVGPFDEMKSLKEKFLHHIR
jgi:hypothetical protein